MFERYTEAARRLIFFARMEADKAGSPFIEPEHFALALVKEQNGPIRRLLPDLADSVESAIREALVLSHSPQAATNLPLSQSLKRVLAYGAEAAERRNDPQIGSDHMLLGLLNERDCPAARILEQYGVTGDKVLAGIEGQSSSGITREALNALVANLPDGALERAHRTLTRFQVWPPAVPERIAEIQKEMRERFRESVRPGMGMIGGMGGGWKTDAEGKIRNGSYSSGRLEDGAQVTETHRFFEGQEITIIERVRIRAEDGVLSYSQEIRGPGREHRFEIDFEIG